MTTSSMSLEGWRRRRQAPARPPRVAIAGEGALAQDVAWRVAARGGAEVTLSSESRGAVERAAQSLGAAVRHTVRLEGAAPSDVLIVCAAEGSGGRLSASRVAELALWAARTCPDTALILAASGGLALSREALRASGLSPYLILSPGGMPRAAAEAAVLARALDVSREQVQIPVIGGDDSAAPTHVLWRFATVAGVPASELGATAPRHRGTRLPQSDAALAAAAAGLAVAVAEDRRRVLCCGCWVEGAYGLAGGFVTAPVPVGARGAGEPIQVRLTLEERALLQRAGAPAPAGA